jgi:hypothetical protein
VRARALAAAVVILLAAVAVPAAPAVAATVLLRDVDRSGQVQLVDRGPCDDAAACAWPAAGAWGPALEAARGDVLELSLDAAASAAEAVVGGGAPRPFEPTADPRTWRLTLDDAPQGDDVGIGVVVRGAAGGEAFSATLTRPRLGLPRPPGPPPLAFARAVLVDGGRAVAIVVQATHDLDVVVVVSRGGTVVGRRGAAVHGGRNVVRVPLGPRGRRLLRPGRHVAIALHYGASAPLRTPSAVLVSGS